MLPSSGMRDVPTEQELEGAALAGRLSAPLRARAVDHLERALKIAADFNLSTERSKGALLILRQIKPTDYPPERLSMASVLGTIMEVRRRGDLLKPCRAQQPETHATVVTTLAIEGDGSVREAEAKWAYRGTPLGRCVEAQARTLKFDWFTGATMYVDVPFALSPPPPTPGESSR